MRTQSVLLAAGLSFAAACSSEPIADSDITTVELGLGVSAGRSKATASAHLKPLRPCTTYEASIRAVSDRIETRADLNAVRGRWNNAPLSPFDKDAMKRAYVLRCQPKVDLAIPAGNPANVQVIASVLAEAKWDELTSEVGSSETGPTDAGSFTYLNFLRAASRMPYFCGEAGTFRTVKEACQREIAAIFAHGAQETGAHDTSLKIPAWQQAFSHLREMHSYDSNPSYDPGMPASPGKCVAPFACPASAHYYGRGIKQLTHFYNYAAFSAAFLGDAQSLLSQPDRVAREGYLAMASGIWVHMSPRPPVPSMHDALVGRYRPAGGHAGVERDNHGSVLDRFEATVSISNGAAECSPPPGSAAAKQSANRFSYYASMLGYLGVEKEAVEASYAPGKVCNIAQGNPWSGAPIMFNPAWYFDTAGGTCTALTYEPQPALSLVIEGMQGTCTKMFATAKRPDGSALPRSVW
jgi:hypothetical protein